MSKIRLGLEKYIPEKLEYVKKKIYSFFVLMIEIASVMQELMNNTGMMSSNLGIQHILYCSVQASLSDGDCF